MRIGPARERRRGRSSDRWREKMENQGWNLLKKKKKKTE